MSTLHLPAGENILMSAFRAVMEDQKAGPSELVAAYEEHFKTAVLVPSLQPQAFKRFSLVDPNIRLIVCSSTALD